MRLWVLIGDFERYLCGVLRSLGPLFALRMEDNAGIPKGVVEEASVPMSGSEADTRFWCTTLNLKLNQPLT